MEHKKEAERAEIRVTLCTVSTSRYEKGGEDVSGDLAEGILTSAGFKVVERLLIPDDEKEIARVIDGASGNVVIFLGGTGLEKSDITPDVVRKRASKEIPGFGELFRLLSYREMGSSAMLSRACAVVCGEKVVFCLPGSPKAVELGLKLIIPELKHIVYHALK